VLSSHGEAPPIVGRESSLVAPGLPGARRAVGARASQTETVRISLDWVAGADPWQRPEVIARAREAARALEAHGLRVELVRGHAVAAHRYEAVRGRSAAAFAIPRSTGAVTLEPLDILEQAVLLAQGPGSLRALVAPTVSPGTRFASRSPSEGVLTEPHQPPAVGALTLAPPLTFALPDAADDERPDADASGHPAWQRNSTRGDVRRPVGRPERVQIVLDWVSGQDPWRPGRAPSVPREVERHLARQGVRLEFVRGHEVMAATYEESRSRATGAPTVAGPRGTISLEAVGLLADAVTLARRPGQLQLLLGQPAHAVASTRPAPLPLASIPETGPAVAAEPASASGPGSGSAWTRAWRPSGAISGHSPTRGRPLAEHTPEATMGPIVPGWRTGLDFPLASGLGASPGSTVRIDREAGWLSTGQMSSSHALPGASKAPFVPRRGAGAVPAPFATSATSLVLRPWGIHTPGSSHWGAQASMPVSSEERGAGPRPAAMPYAVQGTETMPLFGSSPAGRPTAAPVAAAGTPTMAQRVVQRLSRVTPGRDDRSVANEDRLAFATEEPIRTPLNVLVFDVPWAGPGSAPTPAGSPRSAARPTVGATITRIEGGHRAPAASSARPVPAPPPLVFARDDAPRELPLRRQDVARVEEGRAPGIQRATPDTTTTAASAAESATAESPKPPDLDLLARQVYAMLKQRLAVERERLGRPRGLRTW
ncbi:MAG: hypothetical protein ACRDIY_20145, partial [Chloroflexota bacterium]